ncbi:hypothetical protein C7B67_00935 [filamentous cyanobacterium Phorm 6]|nr:hypothetical protein C7B67_00935 [filamentous cyanobacterium Phorm 6]
MRVAFTKINTDQPRQTINGKLVVEETNRLEYVNSQLTDLSQQLEYLGTEIIAAEQLDRKEYINQLKALKLSVQRMEQVYCKLLFVSLTSVAVLTISCLWMGITRQPNSNKSQHNTAAVAVVSQRHSDT